MRPSRAESVENGIDALRSTVLGLWLTVVGFGVVTAFGATGLVAVPAWILILLGGLVVVTATFG